MYGPYLCRAITLLTDLSSSVRVSCIRFESMHACWPYYIHRIDQLHCSAMIAKYSHPDEISSVWVPPHPPPK
jgi:hypothetical protein